MNEAQTRHDLIDPALKAAGWGEVPDSRIQVEQLISKGRLIGHGYGQNSHGFSHLLETLSGEMESM